MTIELSTVVWNLTGRKYSKMTHWCFETSWKDMHKGRRNPIKKMMQMEYYHPQKSSVFAFCSLSYPLKFQIIMVNYVMKRRQFTMSREKCHLRYIKSIIIYKFRFWQITTNKKKRYTCQDFWFTIIHLLRRNIFVYI